jgi:cobalt/nickel transport protein
MKYSNYLLATGAILLSVVPLVLFRTPTEGVELFTGSDGQAQQAITEISPEYQPWFSPFWEPPSGEIESLLFGLQAAIGTGALFFCLGYYKGRKTENEASAQQAPRLNSAEAKGGLL